MKELWNFGQYTLDVSLSTANQSSQSCNAEANTFYIKNISILIIIIIIIKKKRKKIYIERKRVITFLRQSNEALRSSDSNPSFLRAP